LGAFSSPPPARFHLGRKTSGPLPDGRRTRDRSCLHRAAKGGASSLPRHRAHMGRARPRRRGRSCCPTCTLDGKSGRSCPAKMVRQLLLPSARRHLERRTGSGRGTRTDRPGSSSGQTPAVYLGPMRAVRRAPRLGEGRGNQGSPRCAAATGRAPPRQGREGPRRRRATPFANCARSPKGRATKEPGRHRPGSSPCRLAALRQAQSFFTASVSAGTASNRSATRK
jgi:hypothetical protein